MTNGLENKKFININNLKNETNKDGIGDSNVSSNRSDVLSACTGQIR